MGKLAEIAKDNAEDAAWLVAESIASGFDNNAAVGLIQAAALLREMTGFRNIDAKLMPNPMFLLNKHEGPSPKTAKYLKTRLGKSLASGGISLASGAATAVTEVDVAGILKSANAMGSTGIHMKMLYDIAHRYPKSKTVRDWVKLCMIAKSFKMGGRTTELLASSIPVSGVGIALGVAKFGLNAGFRIGCKTAITRTAMELHWRANVEMTLGNLHNSQRSQKHANGPASAVVFELMRRRLVTRVFGQYDTATIISEPAGWKAVHDKLMLM